MKDNQQGTKTKLTPEQEAQMTEIVKKWEKICVNTNPCNKKEAEKAITQAYKVAKFGKPDFIWMPCPISAGFAANFLVNDSYDEFSVENTIFDFVKNTLNKNEHCPDFEDYVIQNMADAIEKVGKETYYLEENYENEYQFVSEFGCDPSDLQNVQPFVNTELIQRAAEYDFSINVLGQKNELWEDIINQATHCHLWYPLDSLVLICDYPHTFMTDDKKNMHSEFGPAIQYDSGFGAWFVHGIKVNRQIIESPETITDEQIESEPDKLIQEIMTDRRNVARKNLS